MFKASMGSGSVGRAKCRYVWGAFREDWVPVAGSRVGWRSLKLLAWTGAVSRIGTEES